MSIGRISTFAVAALLSVAVSAPTLSQEMLHGDDAIAKRKELMKNNGMALRALGSASIGDAEPLAQSLVDDFAQLAELFPEDSQTGDTKALPEIWTDSDGFMVAFEGGVSAAAAVLAAAQAGNEDDLKAALKAMGGACGACHTKYRAAMQ